MFFYNVFEPLTNFSSKVNKNRVGEELVMDHDPNVSLQFV
jgi:hypothetical protein